MSILNWIEPSHSVILVIDFEANCIEGSILRPQEIIEFPCVALELHDNTWITKDEFHHYIKPRAPLTEFCTRLTGITQDTVDRGKSFKEVVSMFEIWCLERGYTSYNSIIATCGNWDFGTAFPHHCEYEHLNAHKHSLFRRWINVKQMYKIVYPKSPRGSMVDMLSSLGISLEGRHHSGIDDVRNISKILKRVLSDSL